MADEEAEVDIADGDLDDLEIEGSKKGKGKLIIIAVVVLLALGGGAFFFLGGSSEEDAESAEEVVSHADDGDQTDEGGVSNEAGRNKTEVVYYDLPEFLVNLNTGGKKTSFLKAVVTLELASHEAGMKVTEMKPRILDSFNTYLRELRSSDLQGSAGIYRLREELLMRINKAIHPHKANDILFKEIIVQ